MHKSVPYSVMQYVAFLLISASAVFAGEWHPLRLHFDPDAHDTRGRMVAVSTDGSTQLAHLTVDFKNYLYLTTNRGDSWRTVAPDGDPDSFWRGCSMSSDGRVILISRMGHGPEVYMSRDRGSTWAPVRPAGTGTGGDIGYWVSGMSVDGNRIVAGAGGGGGAAGRLYVSSDSGHTWAETRPAGDVNKRWWDVSMSSDGQKVIVTGNGTFVDEGPSGVYLSTDGGLSWGETDPTGSGTENYWYSTCMTPDGHRLMVSTGTRGYLSENGGMTWRELQPDGDKDIAWRFIRMSANGQIVVTGGNEALFVSTDGGGTWDRQFPAGESGLLPQFSYFDMSADGRSMLASRYISYPNDGSNPIYGRLFEKGSCNANQSKDGSGDIEVNYYLRCLEGAMADVSVSFSSNGGAAWNHSPVGGSLSGDYGTGIGPGSHRLTWKAAQQLPLDTFNANFRVKLTASYAGQTENIISKPFLIDLQGIQGGLTVEGRVRLKSSGSPVSSATVSLAGKDAVTGGTGTYILDDLNLSDGNTLEIVKTGYVTAKRTVSVSAGTTLHTEPDVLLSEDTATGTVPVVLSVEPRLKGIFLDGVNMQNDYTVTVDWKGHSPGYVRFFANDLFLHDDSGAGTVFTGTVDIDSEGFSPSFDIGANKLRVNAVSSLGVSSEGFTIDVPIIPLPDPLKVLDTSLWPFTPYVNGHVGVDFEFPNPPFSAKVELGPLGKFGFEAGAHASFDYTVTDGDWEAAFGVGTKGKQGKRGRRPTIPALTRYPKMKLYIGNKEVFGKLEGGARGTATIYDGVVFNHVFGAGEIGAKLELGRIGLLDLLGPGLSSAVSAIPGVSDVVKTVSVIIYVIPSLDGEILFALQPEFAFESLEMTGKVGLEAAYEPDIGVAEMRLYVGGDIALTCEIPEPLFKSLVARAYAGAEFSWWIFTLGPYEYVFLDATLYEAAGSLSALSTSSLGDEIIVLKGAGPKGIRTMPRRSHLTGGESFVASRPATIQTLNSSSTTPSALDSFVQIGSTPVPGAVGQPRLNQPQEAKLNSIHPSSTAPVDHYVALADLQIISNAFAYSTPGISVLGSDLMMVYVGDNGISNDLQYTDIRWTRFDGSAWSSPMPMKEDTRAEFHPVVSYDGSGNALAVWERVNDPAFTNVSIPAMAQEMEIVWSLWDSSLTSWTEPAALTTNSYLDHRPMLCGPLSNGNLLLAWTANEASLLQGDSLSVSNGSDHVLCSEWSASNRIWSTPQVAVSNIDHRTSQSLAGVGDRVIYGWTTDTDGVLSTNTDQEAFFVTWSNGYWGPVAQLTSNHVQDSNIHLVMSEENGTSTCYAVWQQDNDFVLAVDLTNEVSVVKSDVGTVAMSDFDLTIGPVGHLAVLWQDMTEYGSDAHCSVYDPVSETWSREELLFHDSSVERSLSSTWDSLGNLTVAYNKVSVSNVDKVVEIEGGGSVTVSNVPQPGAVSIAVFKKALVVDVALDDGAFLVDGENYLPGDALTLSANLLNVGDVAVSNASVAFFNGDPDSGGSLITNVFYDGWLEGQSTNAVLSTIWVVPEPATNRTLYAIANPSGSFAEFSSLNNTQSVSIGGSDLSVELVETTAISDGSVRIIAKAQSIGAPGVTNTMVAVRTGSGPSGAILGSTAVPPLSPGRLAQIAIDLPAGTQPEGEAIYTLQADSTGIVTDIDTNNNFATFSVNLWLDADSDGIPDGWETTYFGGKTNAPPDGDLDEDGMSNYAEWRSGTLPDDPESYLSVGGLSSAPGGTLSGVEIRWGSVEKRFYTVSRAFSLIEGIGFSPIAEHIQATPPENTYTDTSVPTNMGSAVFYRIEVE